MYDEFLLTFFALCIVSIFASPFETRGIILIFRPLLGCVLLLYCAEHARLNMSANKLIWTTLFIAGFVALISLTAVNWTGKASVFTNISDLLPRLQRLPPLWDGAFNPNEVAGVAAPLLPLMAGLALRGKGTKTKVQRIIAEIIALSLLVGLVLGQSISGILGGAVGLIVVCAPRGSWRWVALVCVAGILIVQGLIMASPDAAIRMAKAISPREDVNSLNHRQIIWERAMRMLTEHPLTGVGIANYRMLRMEYPTPGYDHVLLPHAHNEILQIGADLGIPGIGVFIGWYAVAGYLLLYAWRHGEDEPRTLAVALAGTLIGHAIFGLTDAIPLWDRFAVVFWWLLGLTAANAMVVQISRDSVDSSR